MLDEMDGTVKIILLLVVALVVLFIVIPIVLIVVAAILGSFVLGLGEETALLIPVCGPGVARWLRRRVPT